MRLYVRRPIKKGEELTTAYLPLLDSASKRKRDLKAKYGIESCGCPSCSATSSTASDNRRANIERFGIQKLYDTWMKDTNSLDSTKIIKQLSAALHEIEDEGLQSCSGYSKVLRMFMDVYVATANEEMALEYGRKLGKTQEATTGGDALLKYLTNVDNLKRDRKWGMKTKRNGKARVV
jgi:hypothetical protein